MPEFQLVLSDPRSGRSVKLDLKDPQSSVLLGLKVGDVVDGSVLGIKGKFKITGGSDKSGTPMRPDVHGGVKKYALLSGPPGFRPRKSGERRRKLVRGDTVTPEIYQVNAALVEGELPAPAEAQAEGG
ncbi:MAG TPA: 30S ribosomal protein S6e [Nitrososphaeria archaeon]|jgi:small subunit ribosomal protein S6e|uniref:Small ribosomal subunit protein eS6 n=1 Tax=Conexivisphaera calida TaxID=1874277 RepID=A0A4P2VKH6_9ARCH|nr:30S ribosomal protein S6e [Conexivisphaera calida]MDP7981991.1 30S ribosomal protein S6e [Conexivisphaerales archaeon]BBE41755.1 SSU ribosomal protein S6e [Conexivisphaera calida]HEU16796.1 30S ribosomal protein S6e [Nitrososphaeria archaeon]